MPTIPPGPGQWGIVFTLSPDGTRTDLGRVKITSKGASSVRSSDGRRWLARSGELTPPTSPPTVIRRDTTSGPSLSVRARHAKPITTYHPTDEIRAMDHRARRKGLTRTAYVRELIAADLATP
jgi:hypothetical protein